MADPTIPFQFPAAGPAQSSNVGADFNALVQYIKERNDGTVSWDALSVTGNGTVGGDLDVSGKLSFKDASSVKYQWSAATGAHDIASFKIGSVTLETYQDSGEINRPTQPCFLVQPSSNVTDVTGDGTVYTVVFGTEIYDQGGDFASNTFTAPITGRYLFCVRVLIEQILVSHAVRVIELVTSNRTYRQFTNRTLAESNLAMSFSVISDMDGGDTATVTATVTGSTKTVDIIGTGFPYTTFSGSLLN